jgi:hypothetical protein
MVSRWKLPKHEDITYSPILLKSDCARAIRGTPRAMVGGLLAMAENKDTAQKDAWRKRGTDFFRGKEREAADGTRSDTERAQTSDSGRKPA